MSRFASWRSLTISTVTNTDRRTPFEFERRGQRRPWETLRNTPQKWSTLRRGTLNFCLCFSSSGIKYGFLTYLMPDKVYLRWKSRVLRDKILHDLSRPSFWISRGPWTLRSCELPNTVVARKSWAHFNKEKMNQTTNLRKLSFSKIWRLGIFHSNSMVDKLGLL